MIEKENNQNILNQKSWNSKSKYKWKIVWRNYIIYIIIIIITLLIIYIYYNYIYLFYLENLYEFYLFIWINEIKYKQI